MARRKRIDRNILTVLLGAAGAALASWSMPAGLIETLVTSTGISEVVPAAAPPLGLNARLLLALFAALMATGIIWVMRREGRPLVLEHEEGRRNGVQGAGRMGFALSKLTAFARGRMGSTSRMRGEPVLRRCDSHPDAPARAPIFASRDFEDLDIFGRTKPEGKRLEGKAPKSEDDVMGLAISGAPDAMAEDEIAESRFGGAIALSGPAFVAEADFVDDEQVEAAEPIDALSSDASDAGATPAAPSVEGLSIAELTARLERGLADRARKGKANTGQARVIADMPVAPAVSLRPAVAEDVDTALREALVALRTMTGRAG